MASPDIVDPTPSICSELTFVGSVVLGENELELLHLFRACAAHVQPRGTHPVFHKPWTAMAEPYPRGFSRMVGCSAASDIGWKKERLNIAGCASRFFVRRSSGQLASDNSAW